MHLKVEHSCVFPPARNELHANVGLVVFIYHASNVCGEVKSNSLSSLQGRVKVDLHLVVASGAHVCGGKRVTILVHGYYSCEVALRLTNLYEVYVVTRIKCYTDVVE